MVKLNYKKEGDFIMLESRQEKKISKADMEKKVEAYRTLNQVLVSANAEYMTNLNKLLERKENELKELQTKVETGIGTEEDNALILFMGGYVQCLKDILSAKKSQ